MFSVTYTGMNFFPLCTATVCPTNSGRIVARRDSDKLRGLIFHRTRDRHIARCLNCTRTRKFSW